MTRRWVGIAVALLLGWGGLAVAIATDTTPRLGLDLQGGTAVILTAPEGTDPGLLEVSTEIMTRRIEDFGAVQEPEIAISGDNTVVVQLPGVEDEQRAIDAVGQTGLLSFRPVLSAVPGEIGPLAGTDTENIDPDTGLSIVDDIDAESTWLLFDDQGQAPRVVELGPAALQGEDVSEALPIFDPNQAVWSVTLDLTNDGADLFADLTAQAAGFPLGDPRREIAIVLDGTVIAAPAVNSSVSPDTGIIGGTAQITMGRSEDDQQEAQDLALTLRYGSLPVAFEISSVTKVSATLGEDSLESGIMAGLIGLSLVAMFLLFVYRSLALVTIVGLTIFGSLLVTLFGVLGRLQGLTLTLASITGIIVAVGITADSDIVYYERIKDKLRQGLSVDEAADEGFALAFRTILTADTVSLLGAILLWALAVGAVKGFALALGLANILDIFIFRTYTRRAVRVMAESRLAEGGRFSVTGAAT